MNKSTVDDLSARSWKRQSSTSTQRTARSASRRRTTTRPKRRSTTWWSKWTRCSSSSRRRRVLILQTRNKSNQKNNNFLLIIIIIHFESSGECYWCSRAGNRPQEGCGARAPAPVAAAPQNRAATAWRYRRPWRRCGGCFLQWRATGQRTSSPPDGAPVDACVLAGRVLEPQPSVQPLATTGSGPWAKLGSKFWVG